jgi:ankyrin repeat protein
MELFNKIQYAFETHHVDGIKFCFENGLSPNDRINEIPLIDEMINMYTRTPRFKDCIKLFVDYGLVFEDKVLLAVLLDDAVSLEKMIAQNPTILSLIYNFKCTYTPLEDATLMHICAEYNLTSCARVLIDSGADINAKAGTDQYGFGGQTPIFHTVNSNSDNSRQMMNLLLEYGASLDIELKGLIWGKGYDWETLIPSLNPISYAMMGLLPQMHRSEYQISDIVSILLKKRYGIDYKMNNIPNKYLTT